MRRVVALLLALGLLVAGCGSDDDTAATDGAAPAATATPETATPDASEADPEGEPEPEPTRTAAPAETPPAAIELPGVSAIVIEDMGGSIQPELAWPAVDDATWYQLVVLDSAANPYWAWGGPDTSVPFGGGDGGEPGQTAVVFEPMTWSVAAFDVNGTLVGLSEPATLTP
jgi:hypothetical protein